MFPDDDCDPPSPPQLPVKIEYSKKKEEEKNDLSHGYFINR
jgi:hypothetical protein